MTPRQGDVWIADLEPVQGSEQGGRRPILVISGNSLNNALSIVIVVPLSSKIKNYPTSVRIRPSSANGLSKEAEALPFQVRAITKGRLKKKIGTVTHSDLRKILEGLFFVLAS